MNQLILLCICTGFLSCFIDMCFERGMIFRKYYNFIYYWFALGRIKRLQNTKVYFTGCDDKIKTENTVKNILVKNRFVWLFKPLGGCVFCFGTWVCIIFLLLFHVKPLMIPLGLGVNYFTILLTNKLKDL